MRDNQKKLLYSDVKRTGTHNIYAFLGAVSLSIILADYLFKILLNPFILLLLSILFIFSFFIYLTSYGKSRTFSLHTNGILLTGRKKFIPIKNIQTIAIIYLPPLNYDCFLPPQIGISVIGNSDKYDLTTNLDPIHVEEFEAIIKQLGIKVKKSEKLSY